MPMAQLKLVMKGQSRLCAALVLAGLANAALVLLLNRGYASMIDAALLGKVDGIASASLVLALAAIANGAVNMAGAALGGRIAENAGHRLRLGVTEHMLGAECAALEHRHSGESLSRASLELRQATGWLKSQFCPMLQDTAAMLVVLAAMLAVNWKLTIAAFAIVPVITWFAARASKPIGQANNARQAALSQSNALAKSVIDAFPVVKVFDMAAMLCRKYGTTVDHSVAMAVKANSVERMLMTINGLSSLIPMGILLGAGGAMVIEGTMSAGVLLAYLNLSNYIVGPLMNLPNRIAAARAFAADMDRVCELRSDPLEANRPRNHRIQDKPDGNAIALCGVGFSYLDGQPVLQDIDLTVPQGSHVALVGPSGCGKSTVIKLLAALHMPQRGHIFVLGRDTAKWDLAELRANIAVVLQDPFLFPGTILENITCGHDMPMERVAAACRAAGILEFIESQPGGFETDVGERGSKLSGGQRQRVAIARAIAKDAPILLLDEATSALDGKTELEIQTALDNLMQGRTVLTITHRLTGIRSADRIYCMDSGRIAEWGTHTELLERDGLYAGLVRVQAGAHGPKPGDGLS